MTTLHGLVTISEFFAGFNLINTAVVNCLIMCQNASKMHNSEATNTKIFREGAVPPPRPLLPLPLGRGDTPPQTSPPRRLETRAKVLDPQTKVLDPPVSG